MTRPYRRRNAVHGEQPVEHRRTKSEAESRLALIPADTRTLSQRLCGDPIFERSALGKREASLSAARGWLQDLIAEEGEVS